MKQARTSFGAAHFWPAIAAQGSEDLSVSSGVSRAALRLANPKIAAETMDSILQEQTFEQFNGLRSDSSRWAVRTSTYEEHCNLCYQRPCSCACTASAKLDTSCGRMWDSHTSSYSVKQV
jgi:hypothetical protein